MSLRKDCQGLRGSCPLGKLGELPGGGGGEAGLGGRDSLAPGTLPLTLAGRQTALALTPGLLQMRTQLEGGP